MFKKKDGKTVSIHRGHDGTENWKEFSMKGKVPEDAVSAYIILRTFSTKVNNASGVHDLFLCFSDNTGDTRLDWWQFK